MQIASSILDFPLRNLGIIFDESPLKGKIFARVKLNGTFHIHAGLQTNQGTILMFLNFAPSSSFLNDVLVYG